MYQNWDSMILRIIWTRILNLLGTKATDTAGAAVVYAAGDVSAAVTGTMAGGAGGADGDPSGFGFSSVSED